MPQSRYAFYAHLDAPVYEHLERMAEQTRQAKGFIVSEALKRIDTTDLPIRHRKDPDQGPNGGWSLPVDFMSSN